MIITYSRKLNLAQTRYKTIKREFLATVKKIKKRKNKLTGQTVQLHTNHKIGTYANFSSDCVM